MIISLVLVSDILYKITIVFAIVGKIMSFRSKRDERALLHILGNFIIRVLKILYQDWQDFWYREHKEMCFFSVLWNRLSNYLLKSKSNYLLAHTNTGCLSFVLVLKLQKKQIDRWVWYCWANSGATPEDAGWGLVITCGAFTGVWVSSGPSERSCTNSRYSSAWSNSY